MYGTLITTPVLTNPAWAGPWDQTTQNVKLQSRQHCTYRLGSTTGTFRDAVPSLALIFQPPTCCCCFSYSILLYFIFYSHCRSHQWDLPCVEHTCTVPAKHSHWSLAGMSFGFNYKNTSPWIPLFYGSWVFLYDWFSNMKWMACVRIINTC